MKSTSVGNLNGSQTSRVRKFPWNSEGHEPLTVYEVVKDRVETRQFPRKNFFPPEMDSHIHIKPDMQQEKKQPSPVRKVKNCDGERGESELREPETCQMSQSQVEVQPISPQHQHRRHPQQLPQQDSSLGNNAPFQVHNLLKRNQEEINYLKEQIKVKDAKICELEAIVKQLRLRN